MAKTSDFKIEAWYGAAVLEFLRQVEDGRMGYIGTVRDAPFLTGKPSVTLREWITQNRSRLGKSS